jgi:hypothetical protein
MPIPSLTTRLQQLSALALTMLLGFATFAGGLQFVSSAVRSEERVQVVEEIEHQQPQTNHSRRTHQKRIRRRGVVALRARRTSATIFRRREDEKPLSHWLHPIPILRAPPATV